MDLVTLADARELLKHLPKASREKETWQYVAACGCPKLGAQA
jgi:hypothetical protein